MEESSDYYLNEDGLMVFTAAYHLKRGYCCRNRCRHCPWQYGKEDTNDVDNLLNRNKDKDEC